MAARTCAKCGATLPIQTGRGRRRVKCATCSPPRKAAPKPVAMAPLPSDGTSMVEATLAELQSAGVESSALGQAALLLARRIEAGDDNGSAIASMVKQWQDTLGRATAGAEPVAVSLADQLKARRDARRHA
jgi:hypothetical protein